MGLGVIEVVGLAFDLVRWEREGGCGWGRWEKGGGRMVLRCGVTGRDG